MARQLRNVRVGRCHYLSNRGNESNLVYPSLRERRQFLELLGERVVIFRVRVQAFGPLAIILALSFSGSVASHAQEQRFDRSRQDKQSRPGPWDNDVLIYRVATNGTPGKIFKFDRAGVPTLARLGDQRIMAAFQYFPDDDNRAFDRVAVRFSNDEGADWTAPQSIEVTGLEAGLARPFDPTLVPLPDDRIRLYFTSNRDRDFRRSIPKIYSAISSNGIQYQFEPGPRFGVEGRIVIDCAAALRKGVFHLIVPDNGEAEDFAAGPERGERPPSGTGYHAVSDDGLNFKRLADVKVGSGHRWLGNLQNEEGQLTFFGTGENGIWSATSKDGESWKMNSSALRIQGADPGAVKLKDGSWLLAVTSPPRPGTASAKARAMRP